MALGLEKSTNPQFTMQFRSNDIDKIVRDFEDFMKNMEEFTPEPRIYDNVVNALVCKVKQRLLA